MLYEVITTNEGTEVAMKALEYGASEIIGKPAMNAAQFINRITSYNVCYTKLLRRVLR